MRDLREKSLEVLDLCKWAMMRSDQWSTEYDDAIEGENKMAPATLFLVTSVS